MRFIKVERFFKRLLIRFFEAVLPDNLYHRGEVDLSKIKRVLVIRQHDQLGDLLLTTPVFKALRRRFPQARITALARLYTHQVLLHNPNIDEVLVFPEKIYRASPARLWRLWRGLRQGHDLCVVLNTVSHSLSSDVLALLSGAPYRLSTEERPFPGARNNLFYNILSPKSEKQIHETLRSLAILEHIGISIEGLDLGEQMGLTPDELENGLQILLKNHLVPGRTIGIHLGAAKLCNRWPVERYAEVADWLSKDLGYSIAVFWGPKEQELGERFLGLVQVPAVPVLGISLRELAAVLKPLKLTVCNDTGVMHLAAAAGGNVFAIFGQGDPEFWRPLNRRVHGVWGPDRSKASAEVAVAQSGIKRMLERIGKGELE